MQKVISFLSNARARAKVGTALVRVKPKRGLCGIPALPTAAHIVSGAPRVRHVALWAGLCKKRGRS